LKFTTQITTTDTPTTTPAPCSPCENASDRRLGNFLHSAYYPPFRINIPHIPFRILPSASRMPQPHFASVKACWRRWIRWKRLDVYHIS